ncbi:MAG: sugar phosphate isomerase/epimerase [Fimbriimonadaceae bacterium]|nr:sugar phosphate isomerase/epimerase [Fimbriimonadaceae bacterium]
MKFSATSVMLPEHDLGETVELLAALGFEGVEWRCRRIPANTIGQPYSPWGNVKHDLSPTNLKARGGELTKACAARGLEVVGLATNMPADQLDEVRLVAEGCAEWGIPLFRLGAPRGYRASENYRTLLDDTRRAFEAALAICAPLGVKAILEIHRGTVACSASQAYLVARDFDPAQLGVIFDVANMSLGEGAEPVTMGLDLLGEYVAHVHIGGGRPTSGERRDDGQLPWKWDVCDLADSILDVPAFLRALHERQYAGYLSLEDFRGIDPVTKLGGQLAYLKQHRPA